MSLLDYKEISLIKKNELKDYDAWCIMRAGFLKSAGKML